MGKYVKDEWGKRGTYYVPPKKSNEEETHHYYAPGDDYDRLQRNNEYVQEVLAKKTAGKSKYWKKSKPQKKRNWGLRLVLFMLCMLALALSKKPASTSTHMKNEYDGSNSGAAVNLNYHIENMQFQAEQSDVTEVAIRDFCNLYQIDYSELYYDYEAGEYILKTKNMGVFLTEESVKEKGQSLQKDFETYCGGRGSTFGVQMVTVEFGYTQVRPR